MNPAEVVVGEVNRDRVPMHFGFLSVRVRQSREATDVSPHPKVDALHVRRADVFRVRVANDRLALASDALRRRVTSVATASINLVEHSIVNVCSDERLIDCAVVDRQLVSGQLDSTAHAVADIAHDRVGVGSRAIADQPRDAELGIRVDSRECPNISRFRVALKNRRALFDRFAFGVAERPNFIDLHALTGQVANRSVMKLCARGAQVAEQLFDGHAGNAGNPRRGTKPVAFDQSLYNQRTAFAIQPVHTSQYACSG